MKNRGNQQNQKLAIWKDQQDQQTLRKSDWEKREKTQIPESEIKKGVLFSLTEIKEKL